MVIKQPRVPAVVVDGGRQVQRFVPIEHRCSAVLHRDIALRGRAPASTLSAGRGRAVAWLARAGRAKRARGCGHDCINAVRESCA